MIPSQLIFLACSLIVLIGIVALRFCFDPRAMPSGRLREGRRARTSSRNSEGQNRRPWQVRSPSLVSSRKNQTHPNTEIRTVTSLTAKANARFRLGGSGHDGAISSGSFTQSNLNQRCRTSNAPPHFSLR
jgi:hypothetical protein